jgi:hypothetical protein
MIRAFNVLAICATAALAIFPHKSSFFDAR